MARKWKHWCVNGCGKKVVFTGWRSHDKTILKDRFHCEKCFKGYPSINKEKIRKN